jgi:hypothetical protein
MKSNLPSKVLSICFKILKFTWKFIFKPSIIHYVIIMMMIMMFVNFFSIKYVYLRSQFYLVKKIKNIFWISFQNDIMLSKGVCKQVLQCD